jgi:hypothetical protein
MRIFTLILILISIFSFGQTKKEIWLKSYIEEIQSKLDLIQFDSIKHNKLYRIWTDYQVVEFIELNDSTYYGNLTNFVTKNNKNKEIIYQKIKISSKILKKLIKLLETENIETLKDCNEIEGYPKGFDGKNYTFEIGNKLGRRVYSYWEPENLYYQNPEMPEIISVRNILNHINAEFNMLKYFLDFRDRLPRGNYSYGMIHMSKL